MFAWIHRDLLGIDGAMSDRERLRDPIKVAANIAVNSVVHGEYDLLASMTESRYLSAAVLEEAVKRHGQTLIAPPDSAYEDLEVIQESETPPTFRVPIRLWTYQQGLSDLVLELRMTELYPHVVETEVISLEPRPEDLMLADAELRAVAEFVGALVEHDEEYLRAAGAYDHGDPYLWTRNYGRWGQVDLVMPPGDPQTWISYVNRADATWAGVGVAMWTKQEGRSDLTLELELESRSEGTIDVRFILLHVM